MAARGGQRTGTRLAMCAGLGTLVLVLLLVLVLVLVGLRVCAPAMRYESF